MNKKIIYLVMGLTLSSAAQSENVIFNSYILDTETNVVTDPRGLQWLQWSETVGATSVQNVVADYESEGWRIATSNEILQLLNDFDVNFNSLKYSKMQVASFTETIDDIVDNELDLQLISLFGQTPTPIDSSIYNDNELKHSSVYFEADNYSSSHFKRVTILDDLKSNIPGILDSKGYVIGHRINQYFSAYAPFSGVALVRN